MQAVIFCIGLLWSEQHIEGDEIRAGLTRHGNRRFRRDAGEARRGFCSRCDKWLPLREWDSWDMSGKCGQLYVNFRILLKWSDTYKHLKQQINHRNQKQTTCLKCRTDLYRTFCQKQKMGYCQNKTLEESLWCCLEHDLWWGFQGPEATGWLDIVRISR